MKAYFKQIETLRQNGYWSNRAGDFLPLALVNWSHRTVRIYSSKPEQPVIEVQPTLGHLVESEPVCLAYISSPGISEHYDGCIKCSTLSQALPSETHPKMQPDENQSLWEKENDKETSKTTTNICVATFDLQSVLYTPCTLVSLMYYMRKLCCYNLSVYNLSNQAGTCYVWSETEGGRGSCEVATCLRLHLLSLPLNIDHVILYSDACGGQNRNQIIATSLLDAVTASNNIKLIDHKLLESGHGV